jgi:ATP-independent RNA helicase DbpA
MLPPELIERLDTLGFSTMTPVQAEAIVPILAGRDVIAQSKTGSGKTLAFGIPCVVAADASKREPETLIVTPTRELAEQVAGQLRSLAAYRPNLKIVTLYGGVPLRAQAESIAKGVQIVIGTPGRLVDHLGKGTLELGAVRRLVLDEGDRMLEMGFGEEIERIVAQMTQARQTLLFSATFPESIETLGARLLRDPLRIAVDTASVAKIEETFCETHEKREMLDRLIGHYAPRSLLIFCNTKADTMELAESLARQGHSVTELHGDLDQRQRQEAVIAFSNGSRRILVATDVASRGLDIMGIELVINYDLPHDGAIYTHRIGRTGRADATGRAITLVSPREKRKREEVASHAKNETIESGRAKREILLAKRETLCINGGKRQKLRAGDIVGTLAKAIGIDGKQIGEITVTETISYVALDRDVIDQARRGVSTHRIKKKRYSAWVLE